MSEKPSFPRSPSQLPLAGNADFLDAMYVQWKNDPASVNSEWQTFFQGFDLAICPRDCTSGEEAKKQSGVASLIFAFRSQGHLIAGLDPLGNNVKHHPDLELGRFGLSDADLGRVFDTGHMGGPQRAPLKEIIDQLKKTYCSSIGVEYLHIQEMRQRRWLQHEMEPSRNIPSFSKDKKREILERLTDAEMFETFLQKRYPGQKRFSLEGAESFIPAFHSLVELAPELGFKELVAGMAHRGRLNVLANILDKPYATIFSEFEDNFVPDSVGGSGDVKYHKGFSSDHVNRHGRSLHISLTSNPSHLEAVDPVVEGRARAKQRQLNDTEERKRVLPFLVHGDAAFAGQGLVAETLNLSQLPGYQTGGTVHFIINNQIGFTTLAREARSTQYSTDVAKMVEAPIFHVNGDDPEAVVLVTELALRFRQEFGKDVVIDMICYRRHGHNEGDEPAFTQPLLYKKIKDRPSVRKLYTEQLISQGDLTAEEIKQLTDAFHDQLQQAFDEAHNNKNKKQVPEPDALDKKWEKLNEAYNMDPGKTAVPHKMLIEVGRALTTVPDGFSLNPKVARKLPEQMEQIEKNGEVDWGLAELLAFGTLLHEQIPVRLSGQDSARGTFSHRHSVWQDMETQESFIPLNHIHPGQAHFCVHNSLLSEAAVLGFEYGYSLAEPRMLVLWEAQFGDFANGAQVIIDQFIISSQAKWQRVSSLVMLLPHGYEGQGPEHSNAYLERYLMACAEDNIQVCNLTTPAQYFHALRRQFTPGHHRPLIIMSPKSLLRHPMARSPMEALTRGRFQPVIPDNKPEGKPTRLTLCSGKVYYDLLQHREKEGAKGVTLARVEQFYPFPEEAMQVLVKNYSHVKEICWVQEEPQNRGGWTFMAPRLQALFPKQKLIYAGRKASASPATGSLLRHREEQEKLVKEALTC
ncbi:MAG: 2-oxoglutarate dehydrogenase E1 component [Planctomycetota bacterium]